MPPLLEFPLMRGVFAFQADTSSTFVDRAASKFQAFALIFTFDATQTYPLASRVMTGIIAKICTERVVSLAFVPHVMVVTLIVPLRSLRFVPLPTAQAIYKNFILRPW